MFKSIIVLFALINAGLGNRSTSHPQKTKLGGKIVGGTLVSIQQYPYQLSLQYLQNHICGASILSENKALTAAHCTDKRYPQFMRIRAGSSTYTFGGQLIQIKSVCQHPYYNSETNDNDVSVLMLLSNIQLSNAARPINLVGNEEVPIGAMGTITGWGTTREGSTLPSFYLQKVNVPRVADVECQVAYWFRKITPNMICFGYRDGNRDSCQGDSGGPIVVNGKQVGVVSWGNGCGEPGYPGVYAKVSNLRSFIEQC